MLAALQAISQEIYEAAAIDGPPRVQFWRITLPLLRRTISFYVIVSTLGVIQMFAEPYVLTQGGPYNRPRRGYRLLSYINNADFDGAANSFLLMIVVIAIAIAHAARATDGGGVTDGRHDSQAATTMPVSRRRFHPGPALRYVFLLLVALLFLYPLYWMFTSSLKPSQDIATIRSASIRTLSLDNYTAFLGRPALGRLQNTAVVLLFKAA
jgi:ABC-type sugar transport system permease subunit